jgi:hypothetical protein
MAINSFKDVQAFFSSIVAGPPHGAFWNTLSYTDFVYGPVPNVIDPNTYQPISILCKGNGAQSNIIFALSGTPGTLWDPNNPAGFGQMPRGGPYFSAAQIQELSDWITAIGTGPGRIGGVIGRRDREFGAAKYIRHINFWTLMPAGIAKNVLRCLHEQRDAAGVKQ